MTTVNQQPASTETTAAATPAVVVPKAPSLKSRADAIFAAKLADRKDGKFESNKAFRAAVLGEIVSTLGVTIASAATMYNSAKKTTEAADATVVLGRDPKKEKVASATGKRGRPVGSKNKPKEEVAAAATTETPAAAEGTLVVNTPVESTEAAPAEAAAQAAEAQA